MVQCDITLISPALYTEETWLEATHSWVVMANSGLIIGGYLSFYKLYLIVFTADTLKLSHAATEIDFMLQGKLFVIQYFRIQDILYPL